MLKVAVCMRQDVLFRKILEPHALRLVVAVTVVQVGSVKYDAHSQIVEEEERLAVVCATAR
jgi:hypothetical protein